MDQLSAIRVFVRTVEAGSLSRAAETLHMPKSTASKLLADLETYLGTRLLLRSTRSLSLTAEGEEYFRNVGPLLIRLQDMDDSLMGRGKRPYGRVRIDVHSAMANMILIPALAEFRTLYPDIQITVGISDRPIGLIEEGVDCELRLGRLTDSAFIARKIYDDTLLTCASPAYLRDHPLPQTPDDLRQGHSLIGYFSALTGEARPLVFEKAGQSIEIGETHILANESTGQVNMS